MAWTTREGRVPSPRMERVDVFDVAFILLTAPIRRRLTEMPMTRHLPPPGRIGAYLSLLFLGLISGRSHAADTAAIKWHDDFATAQAEAKARARPLWIQFTGPWCHFCVRMDRETFKDPKVAEYARDHFITVKLQSDTHERLALSYGLSSLPATVIVRPTGEVVARREGFADAPEFHAFLDTVLAHEAPAPIAASRSPGAVPVEVHLALAGYCPVSLVVNRRLVSGQSEYSLAHEGSIYRFANESDVTLFRSQPARFIPVNGGYCPVAAVDRGESRQGTARWGAIYLGHLYLCADQNSQRTFLKSPARYAHVDLADRGRCAHCWGCDQLLTRGLRTPSFTRGSQMFLVADPKQLAASRVAGDRTRR